MPSSDTVLLITRKGMGDADSELQIKLIQTYFKLIIEAETLPAVICFYTEGVHLLIEGSPVLELLQILESKGVRLIACTTCLDYYDINEKVAVGIRGGMTDIIEAQTRASKVITL
jgi:intracellular sulfur oxidation DsrE/DsrF family protein